MTHRNRGASRPKAADRKTFSHLSAEGQALGPAAFYAPLPLLVVDQSWRAVDANLAFLVLADKHGGRGIEASADWALKRLGENRDLSQWRFGTVPSLAVQQRLLSGVNCQFTTEAYGKVTAWCSSIKCVSSLGDTFALYFEVKSMSHPVEYGTAYQKIREKESDWEEYGRSYDRIVGRMPYYLATIRRHQKALATANVGSVADLGAGTGNLAIRLAKKGVKVTCVDSSRAMLSCLRAKSCFVRDQSDVRVLEQTAEYLPQLQDASFDGVSILLALFDMRKPAKALAEAIRILKPGGVLVITEPRISFNMDAILEYCRNYLAAHGGLARHQEDWNRVNKINDKINPVNRKTRLWAENIREILDRQHFERVTMVNSHFGNCATLIAYKPRTALRKNRN
jgi:ubiquinone/menaquinone biosynthesis C-methylase UbiE